MAITLPAHGQTGWDATLNQALTDLDNNTTAEITNRTDADNAHVAATDPHGDRANTTSQIATHAAAADPHGDRAYTNSAISTHSAAADPHGDRAYANGRFALATDLTTETNRATSAENSNAANITANTALIGQTIGVVFKQGSTWPNRPSGFAMVQWRGASPGPTIGTGANNALDGVDEWVDLT